MAGILSSIAGGAEAAAGAIGSAATAVGEFTGLSGAPIDSMVGEAAMTGATTNAVGSIGVGPMMGPGVETGAIAPQTTFTEVSAGVDQAVQHGTTQSIFERGYESAKNFVSDQANQDMLMSNILEGMGSTRNQATPAPYGSNQSRAGDVRTNPLQYMPQQTSPLSYIGAFKQF